MKGRFLILLFLASFIFSAKAQHVELGASLGMSNYLGDLSLNSTKIYLRETNFAGGVHFRFNMNPLISLKLGGMYGNLTGTDENSRIQNIRNRNLSFRTNYFEGMFGLEFNLPGFQPYALRQPFSPYLYVGLSYSYFNPKAFYEDQWYELQPLQTEGVSYDKTTFGIPFGLGFKFAASDRFSLGIDFGTRYTFTDYLDDVSGYYPDQQEMIAEGNIIGAALSNRSAEFLGADSPDIPESKTLRGDTKSNDLYFVLGLSVSYHFLDNGLIRGRTRNRNKIGCQRF